MDLSGSWTLVDNFLFSAATDTHYTIRVDNNDVATLTFGDGVNGLMPVGSMTVVYKTGGGSAGNVSPGSITELQSTILDSLGNLVNLTATNVNTASGGLDRESNESIKLRAPLSIRNPTSSIARTDFEDNALRLPSVGRALMQTTNEDSSILDNSGVLYIVPVTGAVVPSGTLLEVVRLQFDGDTQARPPFSKPLAFNLSVKSASYVDFVITAKIFLKKSVQSPAAVAAAIRAAMANFFAPIVSDADWASKLGVEVGAQNPGIDFGWGLSTQNAGVGAVPGIIELSDLMDVVHDVPGVRGIGTDATHFTVTATRSSTSLVLVSNLHADVPLANSDFPRFNPSTGLTIINLDTGASL